jgi:DNA-binding HxlR family transcriptional regulator
MAIWHAAPKALLAVMIDSTDHQYCFSELVERSGLTDPTVAKILRALCNAGLMSRRQELHSTVGTPHVYYGLTPKGVSAIRLSV